MTCIDYLGGFKERSTEMKNGSKALPLLSSYFTNMSTTLYWVYPTAKLLPRQWRFLRGLALSEYQGETNSISTRILELI